MATFSPKIRTNKNHNRVYIYINHKSKPSYIPTTMIVHKSDIRKGQIINSLVLAECALIIKKYIDKLNKINCSNWTVSEVKKYLMQENDEISFFNFANLYIDKMRNAGREKPSNNYKTALNSLMNFYNKKDLFFSEITSKELRKWIENLSETKRAKNSYPIMIKKLFDEGCLEYNDYDRNIIRIQNQPFRAVKIPNMDTPKKRYIDIDVLRNIFCFNAEKELEQFAIDTSMLVFCLAGINTIDLYCLEKSALKGGKLCYNRKKTEGKRSDKAYIEIAIPELILPLFDKYKGKKRLFNFSERYANSDTFSTGIKKGLFSICKKIEVQKITAYWLRHSWATIAQNHCGASTELVAFCLNHTSAHKVTEGYIQKDFSKIDRLNTDVLSVVFGNA